MIDSGTQLIFRRLAKKLSNEITQREQGHCLRVDHLDDPIARFLCECIIQYVEMDRCYVLTSKSKEDLSTSELNTERAIELRNRKPQAFILLVPAGLTDSTASSLRNAFAVFDLDKYWLASQQELIKELDEDVRQYVSKALRLSKRNRTPEPL
ncbi:hypothetical protein K227x_26350 [Rubripirellula lacrimiformis]|uniref:Uncharacterized protein n=1 Tax=Rubripirellula lacrimiformis TaxID=1930273 RepID=A0A517NAT1_9BACT|nr:hypothetical protein [Rubripirellula lacrimiformis]QDT04245.1 hypothetical protein K227x_26350 [Rubripirellula lacrimiformis]